MFSIYGVHLCMNLTQVPSPKAHLLPKVIQSKQHGRRRAESI